MLFRSQQGVQCCVSVQAGNGRVAIAARHLQQDGLCHGYHATACQDMGELPSFINSVLSPLDVKASQAEAVAILAPGDYQTFIIDRPNVTDQQLSAAVRWAVADQLSFSIDEALFECCPVPIANPATSVVQVMVVATLKQTVLALKQRMEQMGLAVTHVGIPELAILALPAIQAVGNEAIAVIRALPNGMQLVVLSQQQLVLTAMLPMLPMTANEALQQTFVLAVSQALFRYSKSAPEVDTEAMPLYWLLEGDNMQAAMKSNTQQLPNANHTVLLSDELQQPTLTAPLSAQDAAVIAGLMP